MTTVARNEDMALYAVPARQKTIDIRPAAPEGVTQRECRELTGLSLSVADSACVLKALKIMDFGVRRVGDVLATPEAVKVYLRARTSNLDHEVFEVVYLDAKNRVICVERLFTGTLTQTSVYPREVVKGALRNNAAGVIFAHNHPSGVAEPSHADEALTQHLKQALTLVDIRVLDHIICGASSSMSFAERGIL